MSGRATRGNHARCEVRGWGASAPSRPTRARSLSEHPADRAHQLADELRIGVAVTGVAERGVEGAADVVFVAPRNRVIAVHVGDAWGVAAFVEREQNVHVCARIALEGIPFVAAAPG